MEISAAVEGLLGLSNWNSTLSAINLKPLRAGELFGETQDFDNNHPINVGNDKKRRTVSHQKSEQRKIIQQKLHVIKNDILKEHAAILTTCTVNNLGLCALCTLKYFINTTRFHYPFCPLNLQIVYTVIVPILITQCNYVFLFSIYLHVLYNLAMVVRGCQLTLTQSESCSNISSLNC